MAEIIGAAPEALGNEEIIQKYRASIDEVTKACTDPTFDFERCVSVANAKYQWMLIRGFQNLQVGWGGSGNDYGGMQPDWIPFDTSAGQEETGADVRLCPAIVLSSWRLWDRPHRG